MRVYVGIVVAFSMLTKAAYGTPVSVRRPHMLPYDVNATPLPTAGDDMETVRLRVLSLLLWPPVSSLPATVSAAVAAADKLNSTCYWPDVDYHDQTRANWLTYVHLERVFTITQAYATPGSTAFENATLGTALHCSLDVWLKRHWTNPNWWYQWIGVEIDLQGIYLMLGQNRTTTAEQAALIERSYDSAWWVNPWGGGANLVWMIRVELMRGLASGNVTAVSQAFNASWADVTIKSPTENGQGIMPDHSYHFHGQQMMSYSYGAEWASDVMMFSQASAGTAFALPPPRAAILCDFMAFGDAALALGLHGEKYDWACEGRGVDRPGYTFTVPFGTAALAALSGQCTDPAAATAINAWIARLQHDAQASPATLSSYFYTSDWASHSRPTWAATVKTFGNNSRYAIVPGECDNSEDTQVR